MKATAIGPDVTNGAESDIIQAMPYRVEVTICGDADFLFHRWNCEAIESKAKAAKGSEAKKSDNVESYVYRDEDGALCIPGEYFRQSIIGAAKFKQDPRSPRKSLRDIANAAIVSLTQLSSLGTTDWDYLHKCRAMVQRNGVTRIRPAMSTGWTATFILQVNLSEYIPVRMLNALIVDAGKLIGVGDFRPSYGRFHVVNFEVLED